MKVYSLLSVRPPSCHVDRINSTDNIVSVLTQYCPWYLTEHEATAGIDCVLADHAKVYFLEALEDGGYTHPPAYYHLLMLASTLIPQ